MNIKCKTKYWRNEKGEYHREDGPAIERSDGCKKWWVYCKEWWINGKRHRSDGPAVEHADGYTAWFMNGLYHREDGPAIEWPDGYKGYWYKGIQYSSLKELREFILNQTKD